MKWIIFEDDKADQLHPLTLMRPVFEVVCGRESLRRRLQRWLPGVSWGCVIRSYLQDSYQSHHPDCSINNLSAEGCVFINGRWLPEGRPTSDLDIDQVGVIGDEIVWIQLTAEEAAIVAVEGFQDTLIALARGREAVELTGTLIERPWDLVNRNREQLILDFQDEGVSQYSRYDDVRLLGDPTDVYIAQSATIDPFVVIDVSKGPVSIDSGAHIQSFTRIEGPCHIGSRSRIFRGLISGGTTIGAECRVGGEIEESILHEYVNKYHEGFLGHSYVCPWVNLGAITTTSDLKSDYSDVKVPLNGEMIDSGQMKVGSFIGDHTKTAIDSMFNTGSSIGIMAMVLPGGRLLPRHIPSFCNVSFGKLATDWPLETSIATARIAASRRNVELTPGDESLIRYLHEETKAERDTAMAYAESSRIARGT